MVTGIDVVYEAMGWTAAECDLMTLHAVFYHTHNRAPSWKECQDSVREHIILHGPIMPTEQCTMFRRLLAYDFPQLADALLAASVLRDETKIAGFKNVQPIKPGDSAKPVTQDAFRRVQQIPQGAPEQQPKPVQQRKPKPVQHVRPELSQPSKPMTPEILPTVPRG